MSYHITGFTALNCYQFGGSWIACWIVTDVTLIDKPVSKAAFLNFKHICSFQISLKIQRFFSSPPRGVYPSLRILFHWWTTFFSFFGRGASGGILVPWPGIEPAPPPPAVEAWSLSHWTAREVPMNYFYVWSIGLWIHDVSPSGRYY